MSLLNVTHPVPPYFACQLVLKGVFQSTQAMVCVQKIPLRKPVIQLHNGYLMHVIGNARTFAFMLL